MLAFLLEAVFRSSGTVPVYALPLDDDGSATSAEGELDFSGSSPSEDGTIAIGIAGRRITASVSSGDTADDVGQAVADAINANADLPVTAANSSGVVTVTVDWGGKSGDQLTMVQNPRATDELPAGVSLSLTDIGSSTGGTNNPDLSTALGNLGDTWYTDVVNPYLDSSSIDAIISEGDNRNDPIENRMFDAFTGYTDTNSNFQTELGNHNSQWITFVPVHGSNTPAMEIAAVTAGLFAAKQQSNPGRPVKNLVLEGVQPGGNPNDLLYSTRNTTVSNGGSWTYDTAGGRVAIGDLVTTRTEDTNGAATDAWRFTIIIPNLQVKRYQVEQTYLQDPFARGVVLANGGPPGPTYGVTPNMVKSQAVQLVENWGELGISTEIETIVENIQANIDGSNPGRINLLIPDTPSAGLRILAAKLEWAFVV
jgi:phage tail sheath gpL-like